MIRTRVFLLVPFSIFVVNKLEQIFQIVISSCDVYSSIWEVYFVCHDFNDYKACNVQKSHESIDPEEVSVPCQWFNSQTQSLQGKNFTNTLIENVNIYQNDANEIHSVTNKALFWILNRLKLSAVTHKHATIALRVETVSSSKDLIHKR